MCPRCSLSWSCYRMFPGLCTSFSIPLLFQRVNQGLLTLVFAVRTFAGSMRFRRPSRCTLGRFTTFSAEARAPAQHNLHAEVAEVLLPCYRSASLRAACVLAGRRAVRLILLIVVMTASD